MQNFVFMLMILFYIVLAFKHPSIQPLFYMHIPNDQGIINMIPNEVARGAGCF